jgi:tetratricopeptide (TPR) repeat protein
MPPRRLASLALLLAVLALPVAFFAPAAEAQERGNQLPRASTNAIVSQTIGITDVTVTYGRPAVRGRDIFGQLVPYDTVWRTGANEATTITFAHDVRVEGASLSAGIYGLFTVPGEDEWTIIFNDEAEQWGAYRYDEGADAQRVTVDAETASAPTELMTFAFEDVTDTSATLVLSWADVRVPVQITVDTPSIVYDQAQAALEEADDWRAVYPYAAYALEQGAYLSDALTWAEAAVDMEANFATLALKARLHAALEQYADAVTVAERAVASAEDMEQAPRGLDALRDEMASWKQRG